MTNHGADACLLISELMPQTRGQTFKAENSLLRWTRLLNLIGGDRRRWCRVKIDFMLLSLSPQTARRRQAVCLSGFFVKRHHRHAPFAAMTRIIYASCKAKRGERCSCALRTRPRHPPSGTPLNETCALQKSSLHTCVNPNLHRKQNCSA